VLTGSGSSFASFFLEAFFFSLSAFVFAVCFFTASLMTSSFSSSSSALWKSANSASCSSSFMSAMIAASPFAMFPESSSSVNSGLRFSSIFWLTRIVFPLPLYMSVAAFNACLSDKPYSAFMFSI